MVMKFLRVISNLDSISCITGNSHTSCKFQTSKEACFLVISTRCWISFLTNLPGTHQASSLYLYQLIVRHLWEKIVLLSNGPEKFNEARMIMSADWLTINTMYMSLVDLLPRRNPEFWFRLVFSHEAIIYCQPLLRCRSLKGSCELKFFYVCAIHNYLG
jgi:hypothetical protein